MKRRYKAGDWIRIPLGGEHDALAIIARACRSRLFGYFFPVPASHEPTHDELRALEAQNAIAALLFGGSALEHARWQVAASSLAFDPQAWPFPDFASRGAFGDAWTRVRYDSQTLQIVERRGLDAAAAAALPDARFNDASGLEAILRRKIAGESAPPVQTVCEIRSPLDPQQLRALEHGGRLQFSTTSALHEFDRLCAFIETHPYVVLRVHGFRNGFDGAQLARFMRLRHLVLDVHRLQHADALHALRELRTLRIGPMRTTLTFLEDLPALHALDLHGTRAPLEPLLHLRQLDALTLHASAPFDFRSFAGAERLRTLELAHGEYDLRALDALSGLRRLDLRELDAAELPPLRRLPQLEELHLHALANVRDLGAIAQAPALRRLSITAMPQLGVDDFAALGEIGLRSFYVAIGSKRKEREIYRLIQTGNSCES